MYEGTGPYAPGMIVDPEGLVAESLAAAPPRRPVLRLIKTPASQRAPRVIRLDVQRALRDRRRIELLEIALATSAGVVAAALWCTALAALAWRTRAGLGDAGALVLVAALQLGATGVAISWLRNRLRGRSVAVREGTPQSVREGMPQ